MKLINHLLNLMFLWSIPFIMVAFFYLLTLFSFSYVSCVTSDVWIFLYSVYFMMSFIAYGVIEEDDDCLKLIKIN